MQVLFDAMQLLFVSVGAILLMATAAPSVLPHAEP